MAATMTTVARGWRAEDADPFVRPGLLGRDAAADRAVDDREEREDDAREVDLRLAVVLPALADALFCFCGAAITDAQSVV